MLAAQYESWKLPLAIVLIVPMCLLAASTGLNLRSLPIDILAQIGFVVLLGLAAKNAILIVEFAKQRQDHDGDEAGVAATTAARIRLRPILMTSFAFILGVFPLAIATGAGAEMRQSLGTTVFSGMLGVTIFGLLFTPAFYTVVRNLGKESIMTSFRNLRSWVGSLLLTTSLTACAVGPDYVAPTQTLAPFHNTLAASAQPAPQLERWWIGFDDPMLARLVQRALNQNLDLAAAIARVREARAAAGGAQAALLPTADLGAGATFDHASLRGPLGSVSSGSPGFKRDSMDYSVGPSASWELDLFGGLRRGASAAQDEAEAAEAEHAGTRVIVAADTADAYLQIRGYQARLSVATDQIKTDEHLVELVKNRHEAGAATDREIAQADALLKQARATVPLLRLGLEQQMKPPRCVAGCPAGNERA